MTEHRPLMQCCAWCGREMPCAAPVCVVGVRAKDRGQLRRREGEVLELTLLRSGKTLPALVPEPGSPARGDGHDLIVVTCDTACGALVKEALEQEEDLFDAVRVADLGPEPE